MDQHKPLGPSDQDQKTDVESFQVCWNYLGACSKRQETIPFTNNWAELDNWSRLERVDEFDSGEEIGLGGAGGGSCSSTEVHRPQEPGVEVVMEMELRVV